MRSRVLHLGVASPPHHPTTMNNHRSMLPPLCRVAVLRPRAWRAGTQLAALHRPGARGEPTSVQGRPPLCRVQQWACTTKLVLYPCVPSRVPADTPLLPLNVRRSALPSPQVAAPFCPDPQRANAYVTNWAVSTVSRSIKLSWMVDPAAAAKAQAQAGRAELAAAAPAQPPANSMGLQHAASLLPPQPAVPQPPQPLPVVHLPAHWQLGSAAQVALSQQRAAVSALMAQMQVRWGGKACCAAVQMPGSQPAARSRLASQPGMA